MATPRQTTRSDDPTSMTHGPGRDLPVSVVVPVRDEERNLSECLSRLDRFAEVVVVDSGSTDRTVEIAQDAGARVLTFKWSGGYPKKRNHVLLNETLAAPWVLFLDADEYVGEAWCNEVAGALHGTDKVGFWLNYTNHFMGRELSYGLPQRKLALLRVGAGLYEQIEEARWSGLDMEVHEHPVLDGPLGEIAARIDHRDDRGLERFLQRHIDYALWEAHRARHLGDDPERLAVLTGRQRFKYRHLGRAWYPLFYFLYTYLIRRGALDGRAGFAYAFYKAWYFYTVRGFMMEAAQRAEERPGKASPPR